MAVSGNKLNLRPFGTESDTERGVGFWKRNSVALKFSIKKERVRMVCLAKEKPNYIMRDLDPVLEELTGNKLDLVGPVLDGFNQEIRFFMYSKLERSRTTGLMSPVVLFIPFQIFKHLWVLVQGYSSSAETSNNGEKITLHLFKAETATKIWSPAQFSGENFVRKCHFEKARECVCVVRHYNGKSSMVVTQATPVEMDFSMKQQRVTTKFYVQRCYRNGFAKDASLQKLVNQM